MEKVEKQETKVSKLLWENEEYVRRCCSRCDDIIIRPMRLGKKEKVNALLVYVEVAISNVTLEDSVIGKLINHLWEIPADQIPQFLSDNALGISDTAEFWNLEEAMTSMLAGNAIFFLDGYDRAIKISSKGYPNMGVQKAESEKVLRGSREGFADSVKTNTALIRKRLRTTDLKVEEIHCGVRSDTVLALVYAGELIYPEFLEEMKQRISSFEIDGVLDSGIPEQLCEEHWRSPFPQFETTERPDRAAMEILNGRIVLLCDNSPVGILLPTTFDSFLKVSEDRYHHFYIASFERLLRYGAMLLALLISGGYLAVTRFHTGVLPTNLLLSFAEARKGVPFPGVIEILLMELAFELIREAGVRMPGPLGGTIGIVGGLIIGDAAVSANLVSPMAVVVVALSALCSFAIPNEEFSAPFRLLKFGFIFLGGYLGIFGMVLGLFVLLGHLSGLTSFGIPYLMPFVGGGLPGLTGERDQVVRGPLRNMRFRPVFARREQRVRLRMAAEEEQMEKEKQKEKGDQDVRG
ncbi:MAG: spore germination protein [Fusicatenibacter sp.]